MISKFRRQQDQYKDSIQEQSKQHQQNLHFDIQQAVVLSKHLSIILGIHPISKNQLCIFL